jgi:drug/metabolite transporter (DMT)-like permease
MRASRRTGPGSDVGRALLSALLFGASTPVAKSLLDEVEPFTLAGLFYLGAAAGLLPMLLARRELTLRRLGVQDRRRLAGAILFGGGLGPVLLLFGLKLAPAASVALWLNLETVATALLAVLLFREHLSPRGWLANLGVFAAGLLLGFESAPIALGGALVALACVCWGLDNNLTATIGGLSPVQSTFFKGLGAGAANLALGLALGGGRLPGAAPLAVALATGVLSYGVSVVLYISAAQRLGATRSQMLFASAPFWGAAGSVLVLNEAVSLQQAGAAALLAGALVLLFRDRHEHRHVHEALEHVHTHGHADGHHTHEHPGLTSDVVHTHWHRHEPLEHAHPHWPDLHHRHGH